MNILMLSSFLPYPLFSGGQIRLYNLIKQLSKRHTITLIAEKRAQQTATDVAEVEKICQKVIVVERKKQWSIQNILKAGFSARPFLIVGHTDQKVQELLQKELDKKIYDVLHVETFYVMQNLPKNFALPTVLVEHNIEYLVYKKYADNAPIFLRPFLAYDIAKLKRIEESFWKKASRLVAVSESEKAIMKRDDVVVVPNGVDVKKFAISRTKSTDEIRVLFIGDFKWVQNRDAVAWILTEIWPKISSKLEVRSSKLPIMLWIVGKNIPVSLKRLTNDPAIVFDENAPDETEKIYQKSDVLLAPIRVGGGTSYKILEAMASQTPVVTTKLGAEGLEIKHEKEVLIGTTSDELAANVVKLLADKSLAEKLSQQARKMVETNYTWEEIVKKLEAVYASAI